MIKIKEKFLCGKRQDQDLCEDGIFIGEHFVAVVDGVTSKGTLRWQGDMTSGRFAKETILRTLADMPADVSCDAFFDILDKALGDAARAAHPDAGLSDLPRACIVAYSVFHRQVWMAGDCAFMIGRTRFTNAKKIDEVLSDLRAAVIEAALANGATVADIAENDVGREMITPFFATQFAFENAADSPFGYSVLNGRGVAHELIVRHDVPAGAAVVLASDGYPVLCATLAESEAKLAALIKEDPLCFRANRTTKGILPGNCSFDDRSFVKFIAK